MRVQLNQSNDRRMFPTRLSEFARATFCLSLSLGLIVGPTAPIVFAAHKAKGESHSKKPAKASESESPTGLNGAALELINRGEWKEAIASLEESTKNRSTLNRESGWLAFGYFYMGQCDDLSKQAAGAKAVYDADKASIPPESNPSKSVPTQNSPTDSGGAAEKQSSSAAQTTTVSAGKPVVAKQLEGAKKAEEANVKGDPSKPAPKGEAEICATVIQAYDALCRGKLGSAAAELALLPAETENDAMVDFAFAALKGKEGRANEAMSYVQRSITAAPDFAWGYRTLGRLAQNKLTDLDSADRAYSKALEIEPRFDSVRDELIEIRLKRNDFDGAIQAESDALRMDPKNADDHYRMAQILTQQYRYDEALRQLETAIGIDPTVAKFYRTRASIKRNQDKLARYQGIINDAIADMQKAVDLSKDKPFELVELASMNQEAGNTNRAADNLEQALKLDPDNAAAHEKLVALLTQEKRYDDLVAEWKRLVDRKPKDGAARLGLAMALIGAGKTDEAIVQLKESANLDPHNPEPHRQMGAIRFRQKDYHAAANEYTTALNTPGTSPSVPDLVALGYAYARNDDYTQAEAAFVTALALQQLTQSNSPANTVARLELMRALAELLFKEQRYSEAAAQMESVCASSKESVSGPMDHFTLMEAKALRDLSNSAAEGLLAAFRELGPQQQAEQRENLIDALLEANRPELVTALLDDEAKTGADDKDAKARLRFASARALLLQGKQKQAKELIADVMPSLANAGAAPDETQRAAQISNELLVASAIDLADNDLAGADSCARKSAEANAKNYNAYIQIGRVALKQGKPKDAIAWARKAIELNQYAPQAYLVVGNGELATGDLKDASANFRRAAELYPGLIEAHRSLLDTLRKLARVDEAKREEEQIAQMEKQK